MKKFKLFIPLILMLLLAVFAILAIVKSSEKSQKFANYYDQNYELPILKSKTQLQDFKIQNLFNKNTKISRQDLINNNKKYILLNFFASWCSNCLVEHEIFLKLKNNNKIDIYGVAWNDYSQNARNFLEKHGNPYKKVGIDSKGKLSKIADIKAVPESFLIDKSGNVVAKFVGNIDQKTMNNILKFIDEN